MIIGLIALQVAAAQPPAGQIPTTIRRSPVIAVATPKQQRLADARALLTSAKQLEANYAPRPGQPSMADLDASIDELKDRLDSLPDVSEMDQLKLQMLMDRMSKAETTLSNLLKKISDTQHSIIKNVK